MSMENKRIKCKRCSHEWFPRMENVKICPHCKSAYWDVERKTKVNVISTQDRAKTKL